ncbi:MAG: inositol monophosphatase family protein [Bernardetiaceae bacterium]
MLTTLSPEVVALTHQVALFIRSEYEGFSRADIEIKSTNSLVSYVDKQAEKELIEGLTDLLPEAGFVAEEGGGEHRPGHYNWIVDPLDGTTNFVHGIPTFSISVALADAEDNILLGVVHEVMRGETFHALKGGGAFLNNRPIRCSPVTQLSESLIATGFPYESFTKVEDYLQILRQFMQHSHGMRRIGSAAVDLAYVACGRFEGFFEYGLKPWDVAAGMLLVSEAGGQISDFSGRPRTLYDFEILAACPGVQARMLEVIRDAEKPSRSR